MPRLTAEQVQRIRAESALFNVPHGALARFYGVGAESIRRITRGTSYQHLPILSTSAQEALLANRITAALSHEVQQACEAAQRSMFHLRACDFVGVPPGLEDRVNELTSRAASLEKDLGKLADAVSKESI